MELEYSTALVAMSFVMVPLAAVYFVDKLRSPARSAGRYWALVFVSALLCSVAYFVSGQSDGIWWAVAAGNATMTFTVGAIWMGSRAFNRRRTYVLAVVLLSAVVGVASALPSSGGTTWAGAAEKMAALALFSVLAVIECLRSPLRSYPGAWVLAATLAAQAVFVIARSAVYLTSGPSSAIYEAVFSTRATTLMNILLVITGGASIIAIRLQSARRELTRYSADGHRRRVEDPRTFERLAAEGLARRPEAVLVLGTVDLIATLRGAFGVAHAKDVTRSLTQAMIDRIPDDALLGRLPDDRFAALLFSRPGTDPGDALAAASGLAELMRTDYARTAPLEDASAPSFAVVPVPASRPAAEPGQGSGRHPASDRLHRAIATATDALAHDLDVRLGRASGQA
ncbi:hypothetical protein VD659_02330 [Herbiconiux sp. 11R-BC]|uniref:hypothetical protein n=1 Tax=Herbiconiux sp. 11R-BC TaxID=3111637 RepID=UPI003C0DE1C4